VVVDAIADIGADGASYRDQWQTQGVELITFAELESRFAGEKHTAL
jgi:hypothetical protein